MDTWSLDKILETIAQNKITVYKIHKETGLSQPGLNKIIKGSVKKPHSSTLKELTSYLKKYDNPAENEGHKPGLALFALDQEEHYKERGKKLQLELMNADKEGRPLSMEVTLEMVNFIQNSIQAMNYIDEAESTSPNKK
jgi:DNA-binding Xre family transcriptional regulator